MSDYGIGLGSTSSAPLSDTSSNVQTDEEELNHETDVKEKSNINEETKRDEENNKMNNETVPKPKPAIAEKTKIWERKQVWSEKEEQSNLWNKKEEEKIKETEDESKDEKQEPTYTYESAIQGYRSRVKSNLNNGNFSYLKNTTEPKVEKDEEANIIVPKGSILKRKELFENDKLFELNSYESIASRRLCEDFVHSQSLKERLLSLEKYTEQPLRSEESTKKSSSKMLESIKSDLEKNKNTSVINNKNENWSNKNEETSDRSSSPETNLFVNKLEKFHNSLENLAGDTDRDGSECGTNNYPASNSSTELLGKIPHFKNNQFF